jgi:hypothetical protein
VKVKDQTAQFLILEFPSNTLWIEAGTLGLGATAGGNGGDIGDCFPQSRRKSKQDVENTSIIGQICYIVFFTR